MPKSLLLLTLLTLVAGPTLADALAPPRLLLPTRGGPWSISRIYSPVHDGTNFLVIGTTSPSESRYAISGADWLSQLAIVAPDGTQLSRPIPLPPAYTHYQWADNYFLLNRHTFARVSGEGELLDRAPRPLPVADNVNLPEFDSSNHRLLVYYPDRRAAWLLDSEGETVPFTGLPEGKISAIEGKEGHFLIAYVPPGETFLRLRLIADDGRTMRDERVAGVDAILGTDGHTWMAVGLGSSRVSFLDNEFRVVGFHTPLKGSLRPIRGRGYFYDYTVTAPLTVRDQIYTEMRAPAYTPVTFARPMSSSEDRGPFIAGNAHALFLVDPASWAAPPYARLVTSLRDIVKRSPALSLLATLDREHPSAATNAVGTTLLAWNESIAFNRVGVHATRVSADGAVLDDPPASFNVDQCWTTRSAVVTDGTNFLVGWTGCTQAGGELFPAGGAHVRSFVQNREGVPDRFTAIFDGQAYLAGWPDRQLTRFFRVLPNGSSFPFTPSSLVWHPRVAPRSGGGYLLAYMDRERNSVMTVGLTEDLRLDGKPQQVAGLAGKPMALHAVGDRYLFVVDSTEVVAMWLDVDGKALHSPVLVAPDSAEADRAYAKVFCESECTLVWKHVRAAEPPRVFASSIGTTSSGEVSFGEPVLLVTYDPHYPYGDVVHFRGTAQSPRMLIRQAADPDRGGMQLVVHEPPSVKRRATRH